MANDHTWGSLKSVLKRRFKKPLSFARLLLEAATYTASPGQRSGDYCFEKLSKLRALKLRIPDSCLEDAVIGGIADENIARTIRSKKYNDIDELYAAMHEMGSMPRATEPKIIPRPVAYQRGPMNKTVPTASTSTAKLTSSTPAEATQRPSIVCFNCGTVGHISVKSPKTAVICKSCDKKGHLDRFCSRPKRVNATQEIRDSSPKHWRMDDRG
ncbi:uncharacterized protein LOC128888082 isoform X1 [Hylaeus anthracinus]|uniref:uncharacterized protein LOC128888082 isoform X1 n=1 Tax=Hylaeus anthracinus TaxID=313031 RepID=UPI0023B950F9|nr:uncharacterized protein LOC128888082 isoform X1 [Hylaeus anthracinus]